MSDRHYVHHEDEAQLAKLLKESRPFFERYGTTIIYGIAAVMAVAAVVVYVKRQPPASAEVSRSLLLATTAEDYQDVADQFSDSPIAALARLRQADRELEDSVSNMFTNREAAKDNLESAEKAYTLLEDRKDVNDSVRERVLVGLARVAECRCDGTDQTMKAATAAWERVLTAFPESKTFKAIAEARIKRLASEDSRQFYAWFSTQNPKPGDDLMMPQDGMPGQVPAAPTLPSMLNFGLPDASTAKPPVPTEVPKPDTPAESSVTPETPAAEPASEAPAPEPASETPATETPAAEPATGTPSTDAPPADAPEKSGE